MVHGRLTQENDASFILDGNGMRHFENRVIWDGYLSHWSGEKVFAREFFIILTTPFVPSSYEGGAKGVV